MPKLYAGLDISDKSTSICVVDEDGSVVLEAASATNATAIQLALKPVRRSLKSIGMESGSRAVRVYKQFTRAKLPVVCMDAFHAHSVLATRLNKTDANDALGLATLLAKGMYRASYVKGEGAYELKALLLLRQVLLLRANNIDRVRLDYRKLLGFVDVRKPKRVGLRGSRSSISGCRSRSITAMTASNTLSRDIS